MRLNCGDGEDSWESLGLQGDPTSQHWRKSVLNIHWKNWCWSWSSSTWPPDANSQLIGKDPDAGKDWRQKKGTTEDEMIGWHHRLNGPEFEQALGDGEGQGSLVCCSPWGVTKSRTQLRDWTKTYPSSHFAIQILYHFTLHLTPEANIMFYVNNTSILKNGII